MEKSIKALCRLKRPQGQTVSMSSSTKCSPHNWPHCLLACLIIFMNNQNQEALITVFLKPGKDELDCSSYRPISQCQKHYPKSPKYNI